MKKEKIIFLSKVFCLYAFLLLSFSYFFNFIVQNFILKFYDPETFDLWFLLAFIIGLRAIALLAKKLAVKFIKIPDGSKQ